MIRKQNFVGIYSHLTGSYISKDSARDTLYDINLHYKTMVRSMKRYELTNHLGNVLAVISDQWKTECTTTSTVVGGLTFSVTTFDRYKATLVQATDYHPFGSVLQGRTWTEPSLTGAYRAGFNGKEGDGEIEGEGNAYDFGERFYDTRLAKWLSVDLMAKTSPSWTPYRFGFDNPIRFSDPNGTFEIEKSTAANYPHYASMLKNLNATYASKPQAFRDAFKQYSQLTDAQVHTMLEYKVVPDGTPITPNQPTPRIKVEEVGTTKSGTTINGITPSRYTSEDANGNSLGSIADGSITIDKTMVDEYEQLSKEKEACQIFSFNKNVELEAAAVSLESTTFHEGTHYGDIISDKIMNQTNKTQEGGQEFEKAAYGENINPGVSAQNYVRRNNINNAVTKDQLSNNSRIPNDGPPHLPDNKKNPIQ